MSKYSYLATDEEVKQSLVPMGLYNFEGYYVAWQADADALQKVLPPPLKLESDIVRTYLCMIHNCTDLPRYRECNLTIKCSMNGSVGWYTLLMPVEGPGAEMAAYLGREGMKIPKKVADAFTIDRMGPMGRAQVVRGGVPLFDVKADINGQYNDPAAEEVFKDFVPGGTVNNDSFLFQYNKGYVEGKPAYFGGRMLLAACHLEMKKWEKATIEIELGETPNDPIAEIGVIKPIGGAYCVFDLFITGAQDMGEVDTAEGIKRVLKQRFDVGTYGHYEQEL
ncbi:MAG: acetoacetate decarboxylase family protein [Ruminococcaceae bacterium]|nr:acetoacetate decarboxylase family protein [Oscillospiraceae bacterium]